MPTTTLKKINKQGLPFKDFTCPFCNLKKDDSNEFWVADLEYGSLYLNYNQSFKGRCLYIPFKHYKSLKDIKDLEFISYNKEILLIYRTLVDTFKADLVNIAMLGNKVNHLHWHLIPRYKNDANWGNAPWPNIEKKLSLKEIKILKRILSQELSLEIPRNRIKHLIN
jgi:histidine triad (HIT) family protein